MSLSPVNTLISELLENALKDKADLSSKLSVVESNINDAYHMIEFLTMSGPQMMKNYKMLQANLKIRRKLKESISSLDSLTSRLSGIDVKADIKRSNRYLKESQESFNKHFGVKP